MEILVETCERFRAGSGWMILKNHSECREGHVNIYMVARGVLAPMLARPMMPAYH